VVAIAFLLQCEHDPRLGSFWPGIVERDSYREHEDQGSRALEANYYISSGEPRN